MLLSELTPEQASIRQQVTDTLTAAGWTPTLVHEMADDGDDVELLASLENDEAEPPLTVEYEPATNRLHVTIGFTYGDDNTVLLVEVDDRLHAVLGAVASGVEDVEAAVRATGATVTTE